MRERERESETIHLSFFSFFFVAMIDKTCFYVEICIQICNVNIYSMKNGESLPRKKTESYIGEKY